LARATVLLLLDLAAVVPGFAAVVPAFAADFGAVFAGALAAECTVRAAVFFLAALDDVLLVTAADASVHTATATQVSLNTNPHLTNARGDQESPRLTPREEPTWDPSSPEAGFAEHDIVPRLNIL
jgi:hypothetical protein